MVQKGGSRAILTLRRHPPPPQDRNIRTVRVCSKGHAGASPGGQVYRFTGFQVSRFSCRGRLAAPGCWKPGFQVSGNPVSGNLVSRFLETRFLETWKPVNQVSLETRFPEAQVSGNLETWKPPKTDCKPFPFWCFVKLSSKFPSRRAFWPNG